MSIAPATAGLIAQIYPVAVLAIALESRALRAIAPIEIINGERMVRRSRFRVQLIFISAASTSIPAATGAEFYALASVNSDVPVEGLGAIVLVAVGILLAVVATVVLAAALYGNTVLSIDDGADDPRAS